MNITSFISLVFLLATSLSALSIFTFSIHSFASFVSVGFISISLPLHSSGGAPTVSAITVSATFFTPLLTTLAAAAAAAPTTPGTFAASAQPASFTSAIENAGDFTLAAAFTSALAGSTVRSPQAFQAPACSSESSSESSACSSESSSESSAPPTYPPPFIDISGTVAAEIAADITVVAILLLKSM